MSNSSAIDSSNQSGFIVDFINKMLYLENIELLETIIRKFAHLFEYIILGILMINCLRCYSIKNYIIISIVLCFIYACTDEVHQLFVPGRNGNVIDILIDTIGSFCGILIYKYCKKNTKMIK